MPKGYVILTETIHDPVGMDAYGQASMPSVIESGGKVLVVDAQPQVLEGEWHGDRTVIVEFASVDAARDWYASASYEAAKPLRHAASESNVAILSGFEFKPTT
jgi:uncharacterized protein (DUF1330 family)